MTLEKNIDAQITPAAPFHSEANFGSLTLQDIKDLNERNAGLIRVAEQKPVVVKVLPPGPYVPTLAGQVGYGTGTRLEPGGTWIRPPKRD